MSHRPLIPLALALVWTFPGCGDGDADPDAAGRDGGAEVAVAETGAPGEVAPHAPGSSDGQAPKPGAGEMADGAVADLPAGDPDASAFDAPSPMLPSPDGGPLAGAGRDVGCVATKTLWQGASTLLDAFPVAGGALVARIDRLALVDRAGNEVRAVTPERPLTAVAFDGQLLGAADTATLTWYTAGLEKRGAVMLKEPCAQAVMVSAQRFVCGPANDWDRIFYTYDLVQGAQIGTSDKYTYHGLYMHRIHQRDHFVTIRDGSPPDFYLFRVDALGPVKSIGDTIYHGDIAADRTMAFVGRPSTHLLNSAGTLLRIFTDTCTETSSGFGSSTCLMKDGHIGTLWPTESFAALAQHDIQDRVYAVTGTRQESYPPRASCQGGCKVQQIDPTARLVLGERKHNLSWKRVISAHHDDTCNMLMLNTENEAGGSYTVQLLEHGGP